jgi:hypothetical protein
VKRLGGRGLRFASILNVYSSYYIRRFGLAALPFASLRMSSKCMCSDVMGAICLKLVWSDLGCVV